MSIVHALTQVSLAVDVDEVAAEIAVERMVMALSVVEVEIEFVLEAKVGVGE